MKQAVVRAKLRYSGKSSVGLLEGKSVMSPVQQGGGGTSHDTCNAEGESSVSSVQPDAIGVSQSPRSQTQKEFVLRLTFFPCFGFKFILSSPSTCYCL